MAVGGLMFGPSVIYGVISFDTGSASLLGTGAILSLSDVVKPDDLKLMFYSSLALHTKCNF